MDNKRDEPKPSEAATLKIVMEPLGFEVACTVPERHSAKMVQAAEIAMTTLGQVLMLWVGAGTNYPAWMIIMLVLAPVSVSTKIRRKR